MKRNTLIVLLIALGLGAYVYFYEMKSGKERDAEETSKPAFTFKSEEVTALNLTSNNQTITLENTGKDWMITQPVKTDADQTAVEALLSSVAGATIDRSLVMTPNLQAASGVAQPAVTIAVKLKNGTQHKLLLGRKDPTDAGVYAQIDQNPNVLLLPASLLSGATKTLNDLRAKELTKLLQGDVTAVTVKNQNLTFAAERNSENKWLVREPAAKKDQEADTTKPFSLLSTLATEVIDSPDDKVKALLAKPVVEASFTGKENQVARFFISAPDGDNVYVRVEGKSEVFKVSKSLLDSLNFKLPEVVSEPTAAAAPTQSDTTPKDDKK
jgi:Domain of unknown function (DUF4340)